ncbi:hypothetical protein DSO57_1001746 [Entomophthora muscae]|uniref:Uncharacterized protein n=1 Tax=Entomophthora muscae TaxID=34485 RepID=A0ACC2SM15_9FUNG|nr:hypothetical protein DSO57_1001746 [Entomophthora muscae]
MSTKHMVSTPTQYPYSPRAKPRTCGKHVTYYEDTVDEFFNLMTSETYVDLTQLRRLSRYGIPGEMRSDAWKFLLGAEKADRTDDMERNQAKESEFLNAIQTTFDERSKVRTEINKLQRHYAKPLPMASYENVIGAYLHNHPEAEFSTNWVHLATPFLLTMSNRVDVYHCFKNLLEKLV